MRTYTEPSRQIPVADEADVLVCGAGPAGVGAARGILPRSVPVADIQTELLKQGVEP